MTRMAKGIRVGAIVCAVLAAWLMWSWNIDIPTSVMWAGSVAVLVVFAPWLLAWLFEVFAAFTVVALFGGSLLTLWGMRGCGRLLAWTLSGRLLRAIWGDWIEGLRRDVESRVDSLDHVRDTLRTILS
ncbi:MAG TPA: hypothetical protein VFL31_07500 [Nitrospiraceae bacterium]|nr:hypothetical protein [Nitrospiraceae bacterium]